MPLKPRCKPSGKSSAADPGCWTQAQHGPDAIGDSSSLSFFERVWHWPARHDGGARAREIIFLCSSDVWVDPC